VQLQTRGEIVVVAKYALVCMGSSQFGCYGKREAQDVDNLLK